MTACLKTSVCLKLFSILKLAFQVCFFFAKKEGIICLYLALASIISSFHRFSVQLHYEIHSNNTKMAPIQYVVL